MDPPTVAIWSVGDRVLAVLIWVRCFARPLQPVSNPLQAAVSWIQSHLQFGASTYMPTTSATCAGAPLWPMLIDHFSAKTTNAPATRPDTTFQQVRAPIML